MIFLLRHYSRFRFPGCKSLAAQPSPLPFAFNRSLKQGCARLGCGACAHSASRRRGEAGALTPRLRRPWPAGRGPWGGAGGWRNATPSPAWGSLPRLAQVRVRLRTRQAGVSGWVGRQEWGGASFRVSALGEKSVGTPVRCACQGSGDPTSCDLAAPPAGGSGRTWVYVDFSCARSLERVGIYLCLYLNQCFAGHLSDFI